MGINISLLPYNNSNNIALRKKTKAKQTSHKCRSHLIILVNRRVTCSTFHIEDPQILGVMVPDDWDLCTPGQNVIN